MRRWPPAGAVAQQHELDIQNESHIQVLMLVLLRVVAASSRLVWPPNMLLSQLREEVLHLLERYIDTTRAVELELSILYFPVRGRLEFTCWCQFLTRRRSGKELGTRSNWWRGGKTGSKASRAGSSADAAEAAPALGTNVDTVDVLFVLFLN